MRGTTQRELDPSEYRWMIGGASGCVVLSYLSEPESAEPWHVVAVAVAALAFFVRGRTIRIRTEVFALWTLLPVTVVVSQPGAPMEGAFFIPVLMVFSVASAERSRARGVAVALVGAAVPYAVHLHLDAPENIGWVAWTMAHLFTFVLGRVVHELSETIRALDDARSALAEQAVLEERRRIARELHDIAGHTLAAVMLHVTGARHVLRRDVDDADRALAEAEEVGRRSLDQIRATVSALRTTESGTDAALAGADEIGSLVDEYRRAGLDVRTSFDDLDRIDPTVGVALHRIVREALTNVARHAGRNQATIAVRVGDGGGAEVEIVDRGQPPRAKGDEVAHFGLTGMAERARALGGTFDAGPTADGWRVVARLPAPVETAEPVDTTHG